MKQTKIVQDLIDFSNSIKYKLNPVQQKQLEKLLLKFDNAVCVAAPLTIKDVDMVIKDNLLEGDFTLEDKKSVLESAAKSFKHNDESYELIFDNLRNYKRQ